jgi:hypothetical protein
MPRHLFGQQGAAMWEYYRDIGRCMWVSLHRAFYGVEAAIGVVLFTLALFNKPLAQNFSEWNGINPVWAIAPLSIIFAHLFLRAIYDKWITREVRFAKERESLDSQLTAALRCRDELAVSNRDEAADRVTNIRQALREYAESVPTGYAFTNDAATSWYHRRDGFIKCIHKRSGSRAF